jgi:hypothetical protein
MSDMNDAPKASESLSGGTPANVPEFPQWPAPVASEPPPTPPVVARSVSATAPSRVVGKTRNPWGVWLLGLTIIYPLIWYFKINKELRDYDPSIDVQPGLAVLAITLGALPIVLFIPAILSYVHTSSRIQKAQKLAGSVKRCSALLTLLCLGFAPVYIQSQLNKVWDQYGNPPVGTPLQA